MTSVEAGKGGGRWLRDGRVLGGMLILLALLTNTDVRVRVQLSAGLLELVAYLALAAALVFPARVVAPRPMRRLWLLFALGLLGLVVRAFYFRLFRTADEQSPFSRVRDAMAPLLLLLVFYQRVRLDRRVSLLFAWTLVGTGAVVGLLGILQFFTGGFYLTEAIAFTEYKTKLARDYTLAEWFDLDVENLARGLYGFPIAYAVSLIIPTLIAFALAFQGPWWRRVLALGACALMYAGIFFSFSRSVLLVVPFGCYLAARAARGRLSWTTPIIMTLGYVFVAFIAPHLDLPFVPREDLGTLDERAISVEAAIRQWERDPVGLLIGTTALSWKQWYYFAPHNCVFSALQSDGLPVTLARLVLYGELFRLLFPRRGCWDEETQAVCAGLWCGAYTLLAIAGQSEPFNGIGEYLLACVALLGVAIVAAAEDESGGTVPGGHVGRTALTS